MSRKNELRLQRAGTIINKTSKNQEKRVILALTCLVERLQNEFGAILQHEREWKLAKVVQRLHGHFPDVPFFYHFEGSSMRPDGGILSMLDKNGTYFPILIVEVKNQGTNDLRSTEGKPRQAMGNAIERLGKNVIGFRTAMLSEGIVPFLCFGDGCDFEETSSILDRVVTINMFGPLNRVTVTNEGEKAGFNRGSFFFRPKPWTVEEMTEIMYNVSSRSIHYYYAKYGKESFAQGTPT